MSPSAHRDDSYEEIAELITTLHETEARLESLTHGEIDTVFDRTGRLFVLQRAQANLQRNTLMQQAAVLDALPAHVALLDAEGVIVSVNETWRAFAAANGMKDPARGVGRNYLTICDGAAGMDWQEAPLVSAGIRAVLRGETTSFSVEYPCHSPDQQRWFQVTATPLSSKASGAVVMHLDVTARRKAEEVLQESEERFSGAFEFAPIGVALVSPDGTRWLRVNRALSELFGYSEEEFQTRTVQELTHPDDVVKSLQNVERVVDGGARGYQLEKRYIHKNGQLIEALLSIALIRDGQGKPLYFVAHILDITARNRAEAELRLSNQRFLQIAENITDVFWVRSPDMQRVLYVSPAWERIWGRNVETLYGSPQEWSFFVAPEDRERTRAGFAELTAERATIDMEHRILRPDGEVRWVHVRGTQVRDDAGTLINIIGIVTDITDRKRAASELEIERARLVFAQQVAKVGNWEYDLDTSSVQWSKETYSIFETDPLGPVTFESVMAKVHPDDRAGLDEAFARSIERQSPGSFEHRIPFADGRTKFVEQRWQIAAGDDELLPNVLGTCQDITERKQSEIALRRSQQRLRDIIDGLGPSMFVGLLTPEGILLEVSRSPLEATGLKASDVIGRHFADCGWWTGMPGMQQQLREAIVRAARGEASRFDVMTHGLDGKFVDTDFSLEPMRDENGRVVFLIPSAVVITERKAAERALRQSQKMDAVGQLAAGVAHEFNNILQALMSMATFARIRGVSPEILKIAGEMEVQLRRGAKVTQQLLAASRHQELARTHIDVGAKIAMTHELLRRLIPENIRIAVENSAVPCSIEGDAGQLQQVLLNLAINARDAMPDGGTLTLRVVCSEEDVAIEVEDDGTGFDATAREHIFEPFFTTKEVGKGTGLGLAVVHGIVEQHGGRIEVRSQPGQGSLFRLIFPRIASAPVATAPIEPETDPDQASGRILLVEDEQAVREGLSLLLTMAGYEVVSVGGGEEALALPMTPVPDLLLSDVSLPGVGGPALAKMLRSRWPDLRVTLMTGNLQAATRHTAEEQGWEVLEKPFDIEVLSRHLKLAMG
ncbi:MAG TPA: PAS domain S-box protein [Thermoanaerobaculia bacterium]